MNDFLAGGAAALVSITIMHPVDVVKTRLQFQGEAASAGATAAAKGSAQPAQYRGVFSSLVKIARLEGVPGLYRGIMPAYGLQFTVTAVRFGIYGLSKTWFAEQDRAGGKDKDSGGTKTARNFVLAALSGACGGLLGAPFFALKTRAQVYSTASELAVGTQHAPQSSLRAALAEIYREEGMRGFFRGADAFVPRVVVYGAAQLGVYDLVKRLFMDNFGLKEGPLLHFSTAAVAASAAVTAIQPFDFLSARLMNQPVDPVTGRGALYNGFLDCAVKSVKAEGPQCLLKGGWANMCRMAPYTVIVLFLFEQFKPAFNFQKE
ncbi:Kidney mitochondrial carrier protein 1 [Hondaea fermentalgiana]|uniref:Kidney mitochondrial carrier protein 1 n=1 Tax=Hondaea fermentalgiana TaxID=2315210 RepID=A0A2R5H1S7_9STRA|nr:Kidney mitochondrial carrier protein 1 [Hondaea fermentalgiana]|eukprot:GBG34771.1 Kidney mitochondrial carrier protein 1 [Hondaea fermentalgiana]